TGATSSARLVTDAHPLAMLRRLNSGRAPSVVAHAVLIGAVAGLLAALLLTFTAEPTVDKAIALESDRIAAETAAGQHVDAAPELVSRNDQNGVGLFLALALTGVGYGMLF